MENELFAFISSYMTLTEAEKQAITRLALFRSYPKGTVLLREGAYSKESYFVLKGCLRCYCLTDGTERTTAFFTEKEAFSPPSGMQGKPSDHYLACVEDSLLLVSTPDMEALVFREFPRFETLCRMLSEELLAKAQASFSDFVKSTPEQRYRALLQTRPDLLQRVPQYQLASYLGVTPETLSRIRRRITLNDRAS